jgi:ABC-type polysaccharide/polyol phosphate transport system ATPase subunit
VSRPIAITVDGVSKRFRLYHERNQSLKASVMRGRRARYDEFWALRDVSFEVPEGSTFAIIGENGSGKSTMLKCMARILRPDEGEITARGKISALLELGAGFHPELSGRDNVYLNGAILGLSKKQLDSRFDDIVSFAGIEQFIDSPVKNYSSGMYVRLGFSVAINVDPDILLIDEVLAVGDAEFQLRCMEKIDELRSAGKTIVIVTHALGSIRHLCDEVVLLEHGELRRIGSAPEVIDGYMGDVFADHDFDSAGGSGGPRWGSGEARVVDAEILSPAGTPATAIHTGDGVTFRFHYEASEPIERPVFGMAIHRLDGAEVTGPNTREVNAVPDKIEGRGYVDLRVEHLMLVPGTYDLTTSLCNYTLSHVYDMRQRFHRFEVEIGDPPAEFGVMSLGGEWNVPGVASEAGRSVPDATT